MPNAIPDGHHAITPHLVIKGASEAIEFYKKAFGATELYRMEMPAPNGETRLGHAELQIDDSRLYLTDEWPERGVTGPSGHSPVAIHLYVPDVDVVYGQAVEAGAQPTMPVMDMPWGDRYGKLVDPFGHHWSIATHVEDLSPEQIEERMAVAMAKMGGECG
jgi:PhnB protein